MVRHFDIDQPNPAALAAHLLATIDVDSGPDTAAELSRFERALMALSADDDGRFKIAAQLRALATDLEGGDGAQAQAGGRRRLESASDEELLEFIDEQVGSV